MAHGLLSSPELNPLSLFIKEEKNKDGSEEKSSFELDAGDLLPDQNPSIINEKAIVRYYKDATKRPIIISDGRKDTATKLDSNGSKEDGTTFDVSLVENVTTGCGGKIWPAAEVLGQYLASMRCGTQWKDKIAVELGAGTGLVGILAAAATQLSKVWITDQIPMLALMQRNLDLNPLLNAECVVGELNWGEDVPEGIPRHPDILLLADCVYLETAFQPLIDTITAMATPSTEILFCYQQRRKADKRFFKLLKKHFTFHDIDDDDTVRRQAYNRQGTHLYRIVKMNR